MTCRGTTTLVQDPGITTVEINIVVITKTDQETDPVTDRMLLEPGHLVGKEEPTLTLGTIMRKRQKTSPEGKIEVKIEPMTLAMVDIIEGAARRPCFMGGPL